VDKQEMYFKNHEECRGCKGCDSKGLCVLKSYYIDDLGNKIKCPCSTCLIKGICIKICDEVKGYYCSGGSYRVKVNSHG